ncbi:MAG TPA: NAD(P)/FAD-dependent oxidoreductase [Propionibacteriaceae bacterium]|nr:NAD(P)/FAD-dependent oxidoreductase [Propionibacteriaceae bacterium]
MADPEVFDVIVIGAGPVGENVAQYATQGTALTGALIERELVGGECSYYACIPSKTLLRPVEVAATAAHLQGLGGVALDRRALLARRDEWVSSYDDSGQVDWADSVGLPVLRGTGRLVGERRVEVATSEGSRLLEARHAVVIATGSEPTVPDLYDGCLPWGSRDATGVDEIPPRLVIVGGGVVACEAAVWMSALGSSVTLLSRGERLLKRVEPFASEIVLHALRGAGVDVRLGVQVTECRREDPQNTGLGRVHGGPVVLETSDGELTADEVLVAVGRRPRLDDVGLSTVGLDETKALAGDVPSWLVLVGDASGEAPLTHWGKYRARVLGEQIAAKASGGTVQPVPDSVPVPQVIFTDPQVASVGLTESEARTTGVDVVVTHVPWNAAAGAGLLRDDVEGGAQLVVDRSTRLLVGATFVGPEAGELLHAATIAITGRVPVEVLRHAVPSYPTASELWLRLLEELPGELLRPSV